MPISGRTEGKTRRGWMHGSSLRLVLLLVLLVSSLPFTTQARASGVDNSAQVKATATIAFKGEYLGDIIGHLENQVRSLVDNPFTQAYASGSTEAARAHLAELFLIVSAANEHYMQVRFLDSQGRERVRVDRPRDGSGPRIIPDAALQDKGSRGYFVATKKLPHGQLWHSRFDLNRERGAIERPLNPTYRVAAPVHAGGRFSGMVIINLAMNRVARALTDSTDFLVYLVDAQGEFLLHPDPKRSWSRYLPGRAGYQAPPPGAGKHYSRSLEGLFKNGEGIRLVLQPAEAALSPSAVPVQAVVLTEEEERWIEQNPIKVGIEEFPPIVFTKEDGSAGGVAAAYLKVLAERTGLKMEIVSDEWNTLLTGLRKKNIDLLPATYFTEERATYGLYTDPYFTIREFIYVKENSSITAIDDLAQGRIAVVEGYGTIPKLTKKYPQAVIVETKNLMDSINRVLNGDVDALLEAQISVEQTIKVNAIIGLKGISQNVFGASPLHLFCRSDAPLLRSILQKGLESISEEERQAILGKWISIADSERDKIKLTPVEQQWLAGHENIRLGIDGSWPPFEFLDEDGDYAGVSAGYVKALERRLGISMKPVAGLSWSQVIAKIRQGELDLLPAVTRTPERDAYLNFTQPYISFPMVIVVRRGGAIIGSLDDLKGKRVGVVKGYASVEFLKRDHPDLVLVEKTDVARLLEDLDTGEIDAAVENLGVVSYEMERLRMENIQVSAPTPYENALSMGVRKDWPEFVPVLDKALASLDKEEKEAIKNAWMAHQVTFGLDTRTVLLYSAPVVGAGLIIILVVVIWNRRLGAEVSERKRTEEELAKRTNLLQAVLGSMTQGIVAFDKDLKLASWNDKFIQIREYPEQMVHTGATFREFMEYDVDRHEFDTDDPELNVQKLVSRAEEFKPHEFERQRPDGTFIEVSGGPIPGGGFVSTYTDITQRKIADDQLKDALATISSSIHYASRIQRSIMPLVAGLNEVVPQNCVVWEPRDVVGGDMYWLRPWVSGNLIILGDCTGHGVPGAFMTLIANGALDQAILEVRPGDTGTLMQRMHQLIQFALGQEKDQGDSDDGMELGMCFINTRRKQMTFSGSRFSLFVVDETEVQEIKGDKSGIGYRGIDWNSSFTNRAIEFGPDKRFYMTSDGIIDQVGGEKRRSFGRRRFMRLLETLRDVPMDQQEEPIKQALADYQGDQKRRDDVSLIGFEGF